jgi:hypothetical protein
MTEQQHAGCNDLNNKSFHNTFLEPVRGRAVYVLQVGKE